MGRGWEKGGCWGARVLRAQIPAGSAASVPPNRRRRSGGRAGAPVPRTDTCTHEQPTSASWFGRSAVGRTRPSVGQRGGQARARDAAHRHPEGGVLLVAWPRCRLAALRPSKGGCANPPPLPGKMGVLRRPGSKAAPTTATRRAAAPAVVGAARTAAAPAGSGDGGGGEGGAQPGGHGRHAAAVLPVGGLRERREPRLHTRQQRGQQKRLQRKRRVDRRAGSFLWPTAR